MKVQCDVHFNGSGSQGLAGGWKFIIIRAVSHFTDIHNSRTKIIQNGGWCVIPVGFWVVSRSFVVLRTRTKPIMLGLMPSDVTLRRNLNCINRYFEQTMSTLIKKVIWVIGVLRWTVVCDWRFDNLCGNHGQIQVTPITQMVFCNQGMLLLGSNHFLIMRPYLVICPKSQMFCICRVTRGNFEILTNLTFSINKIGITRLRFFNICIAILIIYLRDEWVRSRCYKLNQT